MPVADRQGNPSTGLNAKVQDVLGRAFRAYSADIISEPVPDKFLRLLAELDSKEQKNE